MSKRHQITAQATERYRAAGWTAYEQVRAAEKQQDTGTYLLACHDGLKKLLAAEAKNAATPAQEKRKVMGKILAAGLGIGGGALTGLALLTPIGLPVLAGAGAAMLLATAGIAKKHGDSAQRETQAAIEAARESDSGIQVRTWAGFLQKQCDTIQYNSNYFHHVYASGQKKEIAKRFPRLREAFNRYDKGNRRRTVFIKTNPREKEHAAQAKAPTAKN